MSEIDPEAVLEEHMAELEDLLDDMLDALIAEYESHEEYELPFGQDEEAWLKAMDHDDGGWRYVPLSRAKIGRVGMLVSYPYKLEGTDLLSPDGEVSETQLWYFDAAELMDREDVIDEVSGER